MRFLKAAHGALARCAVVAALAGCAGQAIEERPLYERLGGHERMDGVVGRLAARLASEQDTRRTFAGGNGPSATKSLGIKLCSASGGGYQCEAETTASARWELDLSGAGFDEFVRILREEMWNGGIEERLAEELIDLLTAMRADVSGRGSALADADAPSSAR